VSQNNIPDRLPSIERIIQRVTTAEKSNQKEIRITIQEGKELVSDLAVITSKLAKTINEIHAKMDKLNVQEAEINVKMDGGGF
jgi:predicted  nucleic acid-binding Zn-ribbon protein